MSVANFIPEIWSQQALFALRDNVVFPGFFNRAYEGEIRAFGDTVHIQSPDLITTQPYLGTVSYETPTSTTQALLIDQKPYNAFSIPDIESVQANISLAATYATEAGVSMAKWIDSDLASLYVDAGSTVALDVSTTDDGVRTALLEAAQNLDEANAFGPRFMVVSPRVYRSIKNAPDYSVASELGDMVKMSGALGQIEGFNVFMSNSVVVATQHKGLLGTSQAWTLAAQASVTSQVVIRENSLELGYRAWTLYGRKVVRPTALVLMDVTV
jgi:hypothetical protein